MNNTGSFVLSFCGQRIRITSNCPEAASLIAFLFEAHRGKETAEEYTTYDVVYAGKKPILSLWKEDKHLYLGESPYDLGFTLMNEVIYQCIVNNYEGMAIHAAAIGMNKTGILLPGKSGSGKSTLACWLSKQNCSYLTDELVIISAKEYLMKPFSRPISLKNGSFEALKGIIPKGNDQHILRGKKGIMLDQNFENTTQRLHSPSLSLILFPKFINQSPTQINRLSAAQACSKLLECYVNARNLPGHGIGPLAQLTRDIPSFELTYGCFKDLKSTMENFLDVPFPWTNA